MVVEHRLELADTLLEGGRDASLPTVQCLRHLVIDEGVVSHQHQRQSHPVMTLLYGGTQLVLVLVEDADRVLVAEAPLLPVEPLKAVGHRVVEVQASLQPLLPGVLLRLLLPVLITSTQ